MKPWSSRPIEVRNLFNPAFCGLVVMRALKGYEEANKAGMPFSLSLLVLPLCLHKTSREVLSGYYRGYFLKALIENPQLTVGFAQRAATLLPYSLEALGFAMHMGCFNVSNDGRLKTVPRSIRQTLSGTAETVACQRVARFVGKQFAEIYDRVTIYSALGVRP
jgi:hypothetical protein